MNWFQMLWHQFRGWDSAPASCVSSSWTFQLAPLMNRNPCCAQWQLTTKYRYQPFINHWLTVATHSLLTTIRIAPWFPVVSSCGHRNHALSLLNHWMNIIIVYYCPLLVMVLDGLTANVNTDRWCMNSKQLFSMSCPKTVYDDVWSEITTTPLAMTCPQEIRKVHN